MSGAATRIPRAEAMQIANRRVSGQRMETPTEESVYELLGLPFVDPWERR